MIMPAQTVPAICPKLVIAFSVPIKLPRAPGSWLTSAQLAGQYTARRGVAGKIQCEDGTSAQWRERCAAERKEPVPPTQDKYEIETRPCNDRSRARLRLYLRRARRRTGVLGHQRAAHRRAGRAVYVGGLR